jgi:serine protease Do
MKYRRRDVLDRSKTLLLGVLAFATACAPGDRAQAQTRGDARREVQEQLGELAPLDTATAARLSNAFRAAAQRALPAVVYVGVEREARMTSGNGRSPSQIPESLRQFFNIDPSQPAPPQEGNGSGFILDDEGHVITNHHVVEGATRVIVRLVDGREYDAEVIGSDDDTDVAVVRITPHEGEQLPTVSFGSSDQLRVGDWVLALGNPLGLDFSVTAGIVSAKSRQVPGDLSQTRLDAYIQTDAAINPGNSGGPLVDLLGRVVGINTAIYGGGSRFVGYGFAVPIDLARKAIGDLLEYGYVRRPQLGVLIGDINAVDAEAYRLPEVRGAEITNVQPETPAARAGLRPGDVILAIDDERVDNATDLTTRLARLQPNQRISVDLWRNGRQQDVQVTLGEFARTEPTAQAPAQADRPEHALGFSVRPLTPEIAREIGYEGTSRAVIDEVRQFSPAQRAGLARGIVILAINGQDVATVDEVERIARAVEPGTVVSMRIFAPSIGETVVNYRLR